MVAQCGRRDSVRPRGLEQQVALLGRAVPQRPALTGGACARAPATDLFLAPQITSPIMIGQELADFWFQLGD